MKTHFNFLTTHSSQVPVNYSWLKRSGSQCRTLLFCSTCGESLQVSFKFRPKWGTEIGNGKQEVEKRKIKVDLSLEDFKEKKARERATFFRTKPNKLTTCRFTASGGQTIKNKAKQEDLNEVVKINRRVAECATVPDIRTYNLGHRTLLVWYF